MLSYSRRGFEAGRTPTHGLTAWQKDWVEAERGRVGDAGYVFLVYRYFSEFALKIVLNFPENTNIFVLFVLHALFQTIYLFNFFLNIEDQC